jgi:hypothetical protein
MARPNDVLEDYLNSQPLNRKMEQLIDLVLGGDPNQPEEGPLDVYTAAQLCGYRRKAARGWTTAKRSAAILRQFHLSGQKLDEAACVISAS